MSEIACPRVSVVLATRNRGAEVKCAADSLLAMQPAADEILIVDQSDDDGTQGALAAAAAAGRLRYLRQRELGLSRARNLGLRESRGDLLIFTDDDCQAPADLAGSVARAFLRWPDVGLVFGSVVPAPHDASAGLIPSCQRMDDLVVRRVGEHHLLGGMGACMAARREVMLELRGFDVCLGAGAVLHSAEDTDLGLRALSAGFPVAETPSIRVLHHGFRTWRECETLADRYLFGAGAMYAKQARLRPASAAAMLAHVAARWLWGRPRVNYGREPRRAARGLAFARGLFAGLRMRLDPATGHFIDDGRPGDNPSEP